MLTYHSFRVLHASECCIDESCQFHCTAVGKVNEESKEARSFK